MNPKNLFFGAILMFLLAQSGATKNIETPKISDVLNTTPAAKQTQIKACNLQQKNRNSNRNTDIASMQC